MKFTKLSIASLIALTAIPCFAANYAADVKAALEEYRAMPVDEGRDGNKFAARNKIFEIGSATMTEKNVKERSDFSKAVCDALKTSKDNEEKMYLLYVLQFTGGKESLETLKTFLSDKDAKVADAARMALEKNSSPDATGVLEAAIKSVNPKDSVRFSAIINAIAARKGNLTLTDNAQKSSKDKLVVGATYIARHNWPEIDYAAFYQEFTANPSADGVKKGISNKGCDRAFVLVAPYVFSKAAQSQQVQFKNRFKKSEAPTQAWVLTRLGGVKDAKKFIIETALETDSDDVRRAAVWALSNYPDAESVKTILEVQQKGDGRVRYHGEWAIAAMAPSKEVDKTLMDIAKDGPQKHEAMRSLRNRGMAEANPFLLKNIKDNAERGQSADALNQLADDKTYIEFAKIAADTKDDDLGRRLVGLANQMAKRATDHAKIIGELSKLEAKADEKTKRALARAKQVVYTEYAKMATESRQKEDLDAMVKLAEATAKDFKGTGEAIGSELEKLKEKTSNEGRQAIDKAKEIFGN